MGAEQSDTSELKTQQQYQQFLLQYSKERDYEHPQFGQVKVYNHNQNNSMICIKKYNTTSDGELTLLTNHLKKRKLLIHPNLFQFLAIRTLNQSSMCSDSSSVMVVSECFTENLEIALKKIQKKYPEQHIWLLIQQIVDPLAYLEQQHQVHGDIKTSNIYFDENGCVKLAEYNYLPGGQPGFQKMLLSKDKSYLSPILLSSYKTMNFKPTHNQYKSDVFSFGLTLLEVLLNESSYNCIDFQQGLIKQDIIDQKIIKVKQNGYSQLLSNFVRELLQIEEEIRPNWDDLRQVIDSFRSQIINMIPFFTESKQQSPISARLLCQPQILSSPRQPQLIIQSTPMFQVYQSPTRNLQQSLQLQQTIHQPNYKVGVQLQQSIYFNDQDKKDKNKIVRIQKLDQTVNKNDIKDSQSLQQTAIKQNDQ